MAHMTFEEFIESVWRNYWIEEENALELYIRKTPKKFKHKWGDYQIASMKSDYPGNGALTRFLDKYEPKYQFYVENILNERLLQYLLRRGYRIINSQYPQCLMGPEAKDK